MYDGRNFSSKKLNKPKKQKANTKFQIPNKSQLIIFQISNFTVSQFDFSNFKKLEFIWNLEFDFWNLSFKFFHLPTSILD